MVGYLLTENFSWIKTSPRGTVVLPWKKQKGVGDLKNTFSDEVFGNWSHGFGLLMFKYFLMMTFRNGEVYHLNFKVYYVIFINKNIRDFCCMVGLISEESLNFGVLTF